MKRQSDTLATRVERFLQLLESKAGENGIPVEEFEKIVIELDGDGKPGRKVRYGLELAGERLGSGRKIKRRGKEVVVTTAEATIFDRRQQRGLHEKRVIAETLLHYLFGDDAFPLREKNDESPLVHLNMPRKIVRRFERKIENLRKISALTMVIDAGSTNFITMKHFLSAASIPFRVTAQERDPITGDISNEITPSSRIITPSIITNSIPIAAAVASSEHAKAITLRIIGGTERLERRSICGESSILWLRACQASGLVACADIAIIGATGYRANFLGTPAFGCDDPSESHLKTEMLRLADNGLRVVSLDSRKLASTEFNCCFTSVSEASLDLIVIDEGKGEDDTKALVEQLCKDANDQGVAVLVGKRPHDSNHSAEEGLDDEESD